MTAIAQGDQIRWLIAAAGRAWDKVMNVGFMGIARPPALDAPELIASKNALSNSAPILFNCTRHDDIAFVRIVGSQAALCNGNRLP
ncbi:hypothetical protein [Bradyrhizobium erythrophlei]|uniref:hypothetical protein n=1 Tax=Bradyrhizobium erythrophlei TaxID=1437360 RepID=UPI001FCD1DB2|nr:hypothetical protein [Bradyrhizobium erythrophlei]